MKIYIGHYKNWWGPYQLANLLQHVGVSEDRCDRIGEWLGNTWVNDLCNWVHRKQQRKVKIRLDRYDTWNMDGTLALIILPMLKQLKEAKHGSPLVDDEDVPEGLNLRSTEAPPKENEWDTDENLHRRWDWVMDELIWTFEQQQPDYDWEQWYYSGEHDTYFEESAHDEQGKATMYEMKRGPKDTFQIDYEGLRAHQDRIDRGLHLFGKYYRGLWD